MGRAVRVEMSYLPGPEDRPGDGWIFESRRLRADRLVNGKPPAVPWCSHRAVPGAASFQAEWCSLALSRTMSAPGGRRHASAGEGASLTLSGPHYGISTYRQKMPRRRAELAAAYGNRPEA